MYWENINELLNEIDYWVADAENASKDSNKARALGANEGCIQNIKWAVNAYRNYMRIKETGKCSKYTKR